ncbi:hypothetical protein [Mycolicibacterium neoaurum]|uniref:hypothetical protein n=1 Tax=Mycolicibacterium neoaurum TaxID=1795 RepID=UPI00114D4E07|nr:hypothetical protein [Mycolicibacterium neoaurum]
MAAKPELEEMLRARFGFGTSDFVYVLKALPPGPALHRFTTAKGRLVDATFPEGRRGVLAAGAEIAVHVAHLAKPSALANRDRRWGIT